MKFHLGSHRIRSGDSISPDVAQDEPRFDFKQKGEYMSIEIVYEGDFNIKYYGLYDIPEEGEGVEMISYVRPDQEGLYKVNLYSHPKPRDGYLPTTGPDSIAPSYIVSFILTSDRSDTKLCQEATGKFHHGYSHHVAVREDNFDILMSREVDKSQLIDYTRRHNIKVYGDDIVDYQIAIRSHKDKSWSSVVKRASSARNT